MEGIPTTPTVSSPIQEQVLLQKKVVSSAGIASIFGIIQIPTSTLTMTDKAIYLRGFISQVMPYDRIGKVEVKPFLDWGFGLYKTKVWGRGVKIWSREAIPNFASLLQTRDFKDLFNQNFFMFMIINPEEVFSILRQKRPDLFTTQISS